MQRTARVREPCLTLPQPETHLVQHQLLRASRAPRDAGGGGRGGLVGGGEVDLVVGGAAQAPRGRVVRPRRVLLFSIVAQVVDLRGWKSARYDD